MAIRGSVCALITPFNAQGDIDFEKLKKLVQWHIEAKTDALVLCGTTGEAPTLDDEEKLAIFRTAVQTAKGKIPLIAGTGTYDTRKTLLQTRRAKEIGVDACLVVFPYYSRPTPEGCFAHFELVAKVGLPVILYHHPGRCGIKMAPEVLAQMSHIPGVIGIKEATGDIEYGKQILGLTRTPLFAGDDHITLPLMQAGAIGVISVVANVIPAEWKQYIDIISQGKISKAQTVYQGLAPLVQSMTLETNPQCVKYAASLLGKSSPFMRLPLLEPRIPTKEKIAEAMKVLKFLV